MQVLSTISSLHSISGYCAATSRATFRNRPEVDLRMLALCTIVTFLRPVRRARSKASRTMRPAALRVARVTEVGVEARAETPLTGVVSGREIVCHDVLIVRSG